jgi:hypothetical protein
VTGTTVAAGNGELAAAREAAARAAAVGRRAGDADLAGLALRV